MLMRWGQSSGLRRLLQGLSWTRRPRKWGRTSGWLNGAVRTQPRAKRVRWHSQSFSRATAHEAADPPQGERLARHGGGGWKSHPPKPKRRRRIWFIAVLLLIVLTVQLFVYVDRHLRPPLMHLAKIRVKQMATQAINKAISDQVTQGRQLDKLVEWKTDNRGKVTSFILNYNEHMRITSETVSIVQNALHEVEEFRDHIPLGQALGSTLIASFGPRIPIKMEPQGAVKVELNTRPMNVGINMVLVEVFIKVVEEVAIVIPFDSEPEVVETEIPISYLLVVGDVPMYYYDGKGQPVGQNKDQAPSLALPPVNPDSGAANGTQSQSSGQGISLQPNHPQPVNKQDQVTDGTISSGNDAGNANH